MRQSRIGRPGRTRTGRFLKKMAGLQMTLAALFFIDTPFLVPYTPVRENVWSFCAHRDSRQAPVSGPRKERSASAQRDRSFEKNEIPRNPREDTVILKHPSENRRGPGLAVLALVVLCVVLAACSGQDGAKAVLAGPAQMNAAEYAIGVPQGAAAMTAVERQFPKSRIEYFQSPHDAYLAVKHRKIDAFAFDRHCLQYVALQNPDLALMDQKIAAVSIVVGSALGREELIGRVNAFIRQYRADGTYREMYDRWILGKNPKMPVLPEPKKPVMTLKIGIDGLNEPMSFYADGQLTGFDIEFAKRLARFLNAKITLETMEFSALIIGTETGKLDLLVASLNATEERKAKMLFSDTYVDSEISFLVRKDRLPAGASDGTMAADLSRFIGKKVGILTGSSYESVLREQMPGAVPEFFNSFPDETVAVKAGKIDGFLVDEPIARDIANSTPGVTYPRKILRSDGYAFAFPKGQAALRDEVNAALKALEQSGEIQKIDAKWFGKQAAAKTIPDLRLEGKNGVIRLATNSGSPPFVYHKDGRLVGYDIELVMRIAEKLGRSLEVTDMDFGALIPSLMSGRSDMAASCITITEERAKSILFSAPYYRGGVVVVVADRSGALQAAGFWAGLKESFRRTFLIEERYKLVLQGLGVTVLISVLSAILGTLLGFGVCLCRRSGTPWASVPARAFIRSIQGTPIVVLLMILYYIVFGSVDVDGILVAVVGFSLNFAAYVSEMMRTGIEAVDKGQHEAAAALGFNRLQAFARITFPQAARYVLPVFRGEFISMVKMTSIVGYIAIQDLTKVSDIIRSRTYEAFFPLIATALIYFAVASLLTHLLTLVETRIDPKRRPRTLKGVVLP